MTIGSEPVPARLEIEKQSTFAVVTMKRHELRGAFEDVESGIDGLRPAEYDCGVGLGLGVRKPKPVIGSGEE